MGSSYIFETQVPAQNYLPTNDVNGVSFPFSWRKRRSLCPQYRSKLSRIPIKSIPPIKYIYIHVWEDGGEGWGGGGGGGGGGCIILTKTERRHRDVDIDNGRKNQPAK